MSRRKQERAAEALAERWHAWGHATARDWAAQIVTGRIDGPPPYDLGIVLAAGERVLGRAPATYSYEVTETQIVRDRVAHILGPDEWVCTERVSARWTTPIPREFLVTDGRMVCQCGTGLWGIRWDWTDRLTVNLAENWLTAAVGQPDATRFAVTFTGTAIAPLAVAAVGFCHGPAALATHPG